MATLGGERTVILSTHILDDVAQTCPYVCVLRGGHDCATTARPLIWWAKRAAAPGSRRRYAAPPAQGVVVNAASSPEGTRYRLVRRCPLRAGSQLVEPTLEDGYMALASDEPVTRSVVAGCT